MVMWKMWLLSFFVNILRRLEGGGGGKQTNLGLNFFNVAIFRDDRLLFFEKPAGTDNMCYYGCTDRIPNDIIPNDINLNGINLNDIIPNNISKKDIIPNNISKNEGIPNAT